MGLLDGITGAIFGSAEAPGPSGAFPGLGALGNEFQKYLLDRLRTPVEQTQQFRLGKASIRDSLTEASATARQRLGDRAVTGGFFDSGTVNRGLDDISRAELKASGIAIRDLILGLESQRAAQVLPFLSAGSGEHVNLGQLGLQADMFNSGQAMDFFKTVLGPQFQV